MLLVLAGLIGDTVMTTPVIIEARRVWPAAKIVVLGKSHNCTLLSACPLVDEFRVDPGDPFSFRHRQAKSDLKAWLRAQRFDIGVLALGDQYAPVLAEANVPVRVGDRNHCLAPYLTHTYDCATPRTWGPSNRLNSLRALGHKDLNATPKLWVSDHAKTEASRVLKDMGLSDDEPFVALHPFGSTRRQWLSQDAVGEIVHGLADRYGLRSVILGGPEVRCQWKPLANSECLDATGRLSLSQLLAVIERCRFLISTDSGPFHIGGALDRPTVGLFRSTRPEHSSWYPRALVLFGTDARCDGCCRWDYCHSDPCRQMGAITPAEALQAVDKVIAKNP